MSARLLLLRHGETEWNRSHRIQGQWDTGLAPEGAAQARAWARRLAREEIGTILSSDLARAARTAGIIADALGLPVRLDARLREQDWGAWTGETVSEITQGRFAGKFAAVERSGWDFRPPHGESRREVLARSLEALHEAAARDPNGRILVVAHLGVLQCLMNHLLGRNFLPGGPKLVAKRALHRLLHDGRGLRAERLNEPLPEPQAEDRTAALRDPAHRPPRKIVFYSQHVLGMGHLFRSLTLAAGLAPDEVVLVSGGRAPQARLPANVREVRLPALSMDGAFQGLHAEDGGDVEEIKKARRAALLGLLAHERPDVFLVELFPFGRKKFRFELEPALDACRALGAERPAVACSLRDILVERGDAEKFERRVLDALGRWFDLVLVHADPALLRLEETFPRAAEIPVPVAYTGFVAARPSPGARERVRADLGLGPRDSLIVASAGGGQVGGPLLSAVLEAFALLQDREDCHLRLLTGPFLDEADFSRLAARANGLRRVTVERFEERFTDLLAAADLSVSQAGYNTCMNILAAGVQALVLPFDANAEQASRAAKLEELGALGVLGGHDLFAPGLAARMAETLTRRPYAPCAAVNLDGAAETALLLRRLAGNVRGR